MFAQFFGNYLLDKGLVNPERLSDALGKLSETKLRLGVLAINAGIMTAAQVDKVHAEQQRVDKRIGEIMVDMGYATQEQVLELLKTQPSAHLLLGQTLVNDGVMTNSQFETALNSYKNEMGLSDEDVSTANLGDFSPLVGKFYNFNGEKNSNYLLGYISLLLKNLVRFIGPDFAPLGAEDLLNKIAKNCIGQELTGQIRAMTLVDADDDTLIKFASRFSGEDLTKNDDYTRDCISEFLNLHNGLFAVNVSNETGVELSLSPQQAYGDINLATVKNSHVIPICFSFGTIYFIISM